MYIYVMADMNTEQYMSYKDVASYVQLSVATIKRYVQNDEIPYYKINTAVRFSLAEIKDWLKSKKKNNGGLKQGTLFSEGEAQSDTAITDISNETGGETL